MRDAILLAQSMLSTTDEKLAVDGVWGTATERAWNASSDSIKSVVRSSVREHEGLSIDEIRVRSKSKSGPSLRKSATKPAGTPVNQIPSRHATGVAAFSRTSSVKPAMAGDSATGWEGKQRQSSLTLPQNQSFISFANAHAMAEDVERKCGLPAGSLVFMIGHEAPRSKDGKGYVPNAKGGHRMSYCGLYQFDGKGNAWESALTESRRAGIKLGPFSGWRDPYQNTLAAGLYARYNKRVLEDGSSLRQEKYGTRGVPGIAATKELIYAAHQQGVVGVMRWFHTPMKVAGAQSKASVAGPLRIAYQQVRVLA